MQIKLIRQLIKYIYQEQIDNLMLRLIYDR